MTVCARFRCVFFVCLSAGYSEVQRDQREDEALDVLNEVVEGAQPVGVLALLHVQQAADLGRLQQPNGMESNRILDGAPRVIESRPINGGSHRVGIRVAF